MDSNPGKIINKREIERNKRAELVCRELRYQISNRYSGEFNLECLVELLLKWMNVAKKNMYTRPQKK